MENLKIRVNSTDESKEAQELFFELGGSWSGYKNIQTWDDIRQLYLENDCIKFGGDSEYFEKCTELKEITLPELRAMVNPLKEYLMPSRNYEYILTDAREALEPHAKDWIEIPEGAIRARFYPYDPDALEFENSAYQWWGDETKNWIDYMDHSNTLEHSRVVWQRATHPEELPFIDDEPKYTDDEVKYMDENGQGRLQSLNDQYAEIEQVRQAIKVKSGSDSDHAIDAMSFGIMGAGAAQAVGGVDATLAERQSTYGCFEDVAFVTENIMSILAKVRVNGLDDLPNTHRMALYMIASKMARIVNGDFNHLDSWHDIGGYSKLIEKLIKGE